MSDIIICPKCGTWINEGEDRCPNCEKRVRFNSTKKEKKKQKPKNNRRRRILTIAIILFLLDVIASIPQFLRFDQILEMLDATLFNDTVFERKYEPGHYTEDEYVSDFFKLSFEMTEPWRKTSDEELANLSELERKRAIKHAEEIIDTTKMSRLELSEWKTNLTVNAEFSAAYYEDDSPVGLIQFIVIQPDRSAALFSDKYAEMIKNELLLCTDDVQTKVKTLCGKEYLTVEATESETTGKPVMNRYYIRQNGGKICMIVTRAYSEKEYIFDEIYRRLSVYEE